MDRSFSLRAGADFQYVWDEGKSYTHSLLVLRARANGMALRRFGFVAGKRIGKAVARNRAKRLMREAVRGQLSSIVSGWDIILIARGGAEQATFQEIDLAIRTLLQRAHLIALPID